MEFRIYIDKTKKFKWKLRLSAHEDTIIATGQSYDKKKEAEIAISLIKKYASSAPVKDLTMTK